MFGVISFINFEQTHIKSSLLLDQGTSWMEPKNIFTDVDIDNIYGHEEEDVCVGMGWENVQKSGNGKV